MATGTLSSWQHEPSLAAGSLSGEGTSSCRAVTVSGLSSVETPAGFLFLSRMDVIRFSPVPRRSSSSSKTLPPILTKRNDDPYCEFDRDRPRIVPLQA